MSRHINFGLSFEIAEGLNNLKKIKSLPIKVVLETKTFYDLSIITVSSHNGEELISIIAEQLGWLKFTALSFYSTGQEFKNINHCQLSTQMALMIEEDLEQNDLVELFVSKVVVDASAY